MLALLALAAPPASAAVRTWVSPIPGNASTALNWNPAGPVAAGDELVFNASGIGACNWDIPDTTLAVATLSVNSGYAGVLTFGVNTRVQQSFLHNAGTVALAPNVLLKVEGDFKSAGMLPVSGSSVVLQGAGAQSLQGAGPNMLLNKPSGFVSVSGGGFTVSGDFRIAAGTLALTSASSITVLGSWLQTGGVFSATGGALRLLQNLDASGGGFAPSGGTVEFVGIATQTVRLPPGGNFHDLVVQSLSVVQALSDIKINGALTLNSGWLRLSTGTHSVAGGATAPAGILELQAATATFTNGVNLLTPAASLQARESRIALGANQNLNLAPGSLFLAEGTTITSVSPGLAFYFLNLNGVLNWSTVTVRSVNVAGIQLGATGSVQRFVDVSFGDLLPGTTAISFLPLLTNPAVFHRTSFADPNLGTNIFAPNVFPPNKLLMYRGTGVRAGPAFENDPNNVVDWVNSTPPDPIVDLLAAAGPSDGGVVLTWTAPNDFDGTSALDAYEARVATFVVLGQGVVTNSSLIASGAPARGSPGSPQVMTVAGLLPSQRYFFNVRVLDKDGDQGLLSNPAGAIAKDSTGPALELSASATAQAASFGGRLVGVSDNPGSLLVSDDPLEPTSVSSGTIRLTEVTDGLGRTVNQILGATFTYNDAGRTADLPQGMRLRKGSTYRVDVTTGVRNLSLLQASASSVTFTVALDASTASRLSSNGIVLDVPDGALPAGGYVLLNTSASVSALRSSQEEVRQANRKLASSFGGGSRPISVVEVDAFDSAGRLLAAPLKPLRLSVPYEDADSDGIVDDANPAVRAADLALWRLHVPGNVWVRLPGSGPDTAAKAVVAELGHLSVFAVINAASSDLSRLKVFPNPFKPSQGHAAVTFANIPSPATVRVFTLNGELVRRLEETDGDGTLSWDGRSSSGRLLAPDVYLYAVEASGSRSTGKLAVGP